MSADAAIGPVEKRRNPRQRALLAGKLATDEASLTIDCVIRNLSEGGALVETASPHLLPTELHLLQARDGVAWDARVIWRRGNKVGLALGDRHDLKESTDRALMALRRVWSHMAGH